MAEEQKRRKKRTHEEVEAARKYYLEEKERRRKEREERKKEREEAQKERQKARELRQQVRELKANRGKKKAKVETFQDMLSRIFNSIPPYKGKLEVGDRIVCRFAGAYQIGTIYKIEDVQVFEGGMYKMQRTFYTNVYGTRLPLTHVHILAKIDKEKFK